MKLQYFSTFLFMIFIVNLGQAQSHLKNLYSVIKNEDPEIIKTKAKKMKYEIEIENYIDAVQLAEELIFLNRKEHGENSMQHIYFQLVLAEIYIGLRSFDIASKIYDKIYKIKSAQGYIDHQFSLAKICANSRDFGTVRKILEKLYHVTDKETYFSNTKSVLDNNVAVNDFDKAIQIYDKLFKITQNTTFLYNQIYMAELCIFSKEYSTSLAIYKKIQNHIFESRDTLMNLKILIDLALLYDETGDFNQSFKYNSRAISLIENGILGDIELQNAEWWLKVAKLYDLLGNNRKVEELKNSLEILINQNMKQCKGFYPEYLSFLASLSFRRGDINQAVSYSEDARSFAQKNLGENHSMYIYLIIELAKYSRYITAPSENTEKLNFFLETIKNKKSSNYIELEIYLADSYYQTGNYFKALELYVNNCHRLKKQYEFEDLSISFFWSLYRSILICQQWHPQKNVDKVILNQNINRINQILIDLYYGKFKLTDFSFILGDAILSASIDIKKAFKNKIRSKYSFNPQIKDNLIQLLLIFEWLGYNDMNSKLLFKYNQDIVNKLSTIINNQNDDAFLKYYDQYGEYFDLFQSYCLRNPKSRQIHWYNFINNFINKEKIIEHNNRIKTIDKLEKKTNYVQLSDYIFELQKLKRQYYNHLITNPKKINLSLDSLSSRIHKTESVINRNIPDIPELRLTQWKHNTGRLKRDQAIVEFTKFQYHNGNNWTDSIFYCAYILKKKSFSPEMVFLFEEGELSDLIFKSQGDGSINYEELYRGLVQNENDKDYKKLYDVIWHRLTPYIRNKKRIFYSKAGSLHWLPFHALPIDSSTRLSDRYELHNMGKTRDIVKKVRHTIQGNEAILFGGIPYEMDSFALKSNRRKILTPPSKSQTHAQFDRSDETRNFTNIFKYLPGTEREVENIENILRNRGFSVSLKKGYDASEESFKQIGMGSASPRIIHLATHGYFFPSNDRNSTDSSYTSNLPFYFAEDPLIRSGLALAGANHIWSGKKPVEELEDGILTAYEISQMDLSNTELVVLSACNTGLGDIQGNEGVFGLQRAFKMAGVKYLIMSLWSVRDTPTQVLMTKFYQNWIEKGMTIHKALNAAQKEMRESAEYSDPVNWAGFVLVE